MPNIWPIVPLGELLTKTDDWISINPDEKYLQVTVKLWGQGVVLRNEVTGAEISASQRLRVRAQQFILSRIDARNGALGLVPDSLDGGVVSSDFPVFMPNPSRILSQFLNWMSKTAGFVDLCKAASEGTTNRVRLKEDKFLAFKIPLPPLDEQRRIVARIEALAAKIEEARGLHVGVIERCDAICRSMIFGKSGDLPVPTAMGALVKLREPDVDVQREGTYTFAGVYCFGKGLFPGATKSGMEFEYSRLTRLRTGDFAYPKLMAWEGALGVVPPDCDGLVVSPEFPVFEIDQSRVLPETLDVYFRTPSVWPLLAQASTGTNVRRRRLHPSAFLRFEMPLPRMDTQVKLRKVKKKVDALKKLEAETAAELDALLPSILDKAFRGEL